jgi:riboflavin synthase
MFTGLIQALGQLQFVDRTQVQVTCPQEPIPPFLQDLAIGDSVAVDGICLTVETLISRGFLADTSPETLGRTTLSQGYGDRLVNLEPSLRVGDKLGGHFVTGHIDGVGYLEQVSAQGKAWQLVFRIPASLVAQYIVPKGSIAVNGVSLTVAACTPEGDRFEVAVIPHTFHQTNLKNLQPGSPVNLEGDILGKYVEKFLGNGRSRDLSLDLNLDLSLDLKDDQSQVDRATVNAINANFLAEHGYL